MKHYFQILLLLAATACKKGGDDGGNNQPACINMSGVSLTIPAQVSKGSTLNFSATSISGLSYTWRYPGITAPVSGASGSIAAAEFNNSGWFVVEIKNNCNEVRKDSVQVTVQHPQGTAPCTPADQSFSFSNTIPGGTFTQQRLQVASNSLLSLEGGITGNSNLVLVQFHPSYNTGNLPPNGVYTTVNLSAGNNPLFGTQDFDKVHVVALPYNPFTAVFTATPGAGKVYISREAGKLKAVMCNVELRGTYNSNLYTPAITGSLMQP